jgi:hypothetical protein
MHISILSIGTPIFLFLFFSKEVFNVPDSTGKRNTAAFGKNLRRGFVAQTLPSVLN